MKKMIVVALAVIVMFPGIGLAMVQGWGGGPGMGHGPNPGGPHSAGHRLAAALNLTPEQSQKLKDMRESLFKEIIPLRNEIRSKRFELRALWAQTNPDEGKILAKQKEINALRSNLQEKVTKARLEMHKVLTPEQQAKWTYLRGRFRMCRDNDRGYGFGPGRGHFDEGPGMGNGPRW